MGSSREGSKKATESTPGQMVGSIKAGGSTASSMGTDHILGAIMN